MRLVEIAEAQQSAFSATQYADAYSPGMEHHFWQLARNALVAKTLHRELPNVNRVLEIGAGPGLVLEYLRLRGLDCWGCELAAPKVRESVQPFVFTDKDFRDLDPAFRQTIEALLLLDVLEHIADETTFLRAMAESFPNARGLVITVPARPELWSNYDDYYGHHRRYNRDMLASSLKGGGFTPVNQRYFFHELYVPMLLATAKGKRATEIGAPGRRGLHRVAASLSGLCSSLLPALLPGTSLIAYAVPNRLA